MASAVFVIKCKTANGDFTLSNLTAVSTVKKLKEVLQANLSTEPERIKILCGYPPKPLLYDNDNVKLNEVNIRSGDTLIIRVEKDQEVPSVETAVESEVLSKEFIPMQRRMNFESGDALSPFSGILMRHEIPSNNSCLFTSIYFLLNKGEINLPKGDAMRNIVVEVIRSDPTKFNSALLEKENEEYCKWILDPINWGGAIELNILSNHFEIEICAVDIRYNTLHKFGENNNYPERGILLYDGIHYDPLVMHLENNEQYLFPVTDNRPLEMAMEIGREARSSRQFTDLEKFKLRCYVCGHCMCGEKEASAHALATGHTQFGELNI